MTTRRTQLLPAPLRGVVPPMVTPLCDRDRLDVDGLERLIEHMIDGGVHGLFILGTSGEAAGLSSRLRRELIDRVCGQVRDRVPVLVGVTDTSFVDTVDLARYAAGAGAHAVVVSVPYYLRVEQHELVHYVRQIVAEQPLQVMLYNIPFLTKAGYEPDTVRRLLDISQVAGMKDSSGDLDYLYEVQRLAAGRKGWSILVGTELLMAESVARGIHGCVGGGGNIHPKLMVRLYEAAVAGDRAKVEALQEQLRILGQIYRIGQDVSSIIKGIKCALGCLDICDDRMAEPFLRFNDNEQAIVRGYLRTLGLLPMDSARAAHANGVALPSLANTAAGDAR